MGMAVDLMGSHNNFYQIKEPALLGPGAAFPSFATPEFHPTTPDNWKGATIHPTGLIKEPSVVPGRNAQVSFTAQGQTQVNAYERRSIMERKVYNTIYI